MENNVLHVAEEISTASLPHASAEASSVAFLLYYFPKVQLQGVPELDAFQCRLVSTAVPPPGPRLQALVDFAGPEGAVLTLVIRCQARLQVEIRPNSKSWYDFIEASCVINVFQIDSNSVLILLIYVKPCTLETNVHIK